MQNENIFVKMDIEGAEIEWVKSLNESHLHKIDQIVMEFHSPYSDKEVEVFDKLNRTHFLLHFHGNNFGTVLLHKNIEMPQVFECTYVHKRHFESTPKLNKCCFPSEFDMPNNKNAIQRFLMNCSNEFL
jgi:hypothetical protein